MPAVFLSPYPRLDPSAVTWQRWAAECDERAVALDDLAEHFDANSVLNFLVDVSLDAEAVSQLQSPGEPELVVSAVCRSTGLNVVQRAACTPSGGRLVARGEITLSGEMVAAQLDLAAVIVLPVVGQPWLRERIIAESKIQKVPLDQMQAGFPVSVVSFKAESWVPAPWRFDFFAAGLDDAFQSTVRLYVNEDYPRVLGLLDGTAVGDVMPLLRADVARQLIAAACRLADELPAQPDRRGIYGEGAADLESMADEYPESVAAAARGIAEGIFKRSLTDVCAAYRGEPDYFEYLLMSAAGILKGEA